ncbi:MAG: hypothetical protein ABIH48_02330 [Candidatus Falkowbacteria bacterium]
MNFPYTLNKDVIARLPDRPVRGLWRKMEKHLNNGKKIIVKVECGSRKCGSDLLKRKIIKQTVESKSDLSRIFGKTKSGYFRQVILYLQ